MQRFVKGKLFFEVTLGPGAFTVRTGGGPTATKETTLAFRGAQTLCAAHKAQIEGALAGGYALESAVERLERTTPKPEFVELELIGASVCTRKGAIGREGAATATTKEHPSAEKARAAFDKALAKKIEQGWVASTGAVLGPPKA